MTKSERKPKPEPKAKPCKACDDPDHYVRHSCGLKGLQDMLSFGPSKKRKR